MRQKALPRGLYAVTDRRLIPHSSFEAAVRDALVGGARTIQYRDKQSSGPCQLEEAILVRSLCREFGATFIVNDDVDLALSSDADGVHIGRADGCCRNIRSRAGDDFLIGVSCYDSLERATKAQDETADYVAFGSAFPSITKPDAVQAPMSLFSDAIAKLDIPIVAIGGINSANGKLLVDAGCTALAVISSLFGAPNIRQEALAFARMFGQDGRIENLVLNTATEDIS